MVFAEGPNTVDCAIGQYVKGFVRNTAALLALLLVLLTSRSVPAQTADLGAQAPSKGNALLVLLVAADESSKARETLFIAELEMRLDGVRVVAVDPGMPAFAKKPLADQIATVRTLLARHRGIAATWLNTTSPDLILLNMVVLSSGQALVRLVEGDPGKPGFVIDLAMAARVLLGTAFLFEPPPAEETTLRSVVESVREQAAPAKQSGWLLGALGGVGGGIAGQQGPALTAGATLLAERRVAGGVHIGAVLDVLAGPLDSGAVEINGLSVLPGVSAAYLWDIGRFQLGPAGGLRASWTNLWVETAAGTQGVAFWRGRLDLGVRARWHITDGLSLAAGAACGLSPWTRELTLRSSGETILNTPWLAWQASLGLVMHL